MDNLYTQVGVFGVFAILVVREVLRFVSEWKEKKQPTINGLPPGGCPLKGMDSWTKWVTERLNSVTGELAYLRSWHEKEDPESGVPRGHVPHRRIRDIDHTLQAAQRDIQECKDLLKKLSTGSSSSS